jgi:superfamily II DNA/RNA helicase
LSATIDKIKDFLYYKKDLREMINNKYLCDYVIHVPIFSKDPTNRNICEHLLKNYLNIIVYCNSRKEGKKINKLFNEIRKGSSSYIDCETSKNKRNEIIEKYKNGDILFLINVRILVEGFDAAITKGVCFMHLPSSKTTIIQIIGRALRLHYLKSYAHIILPFSSDEDGKDINNFLKIMAQNDTTIKNSYENKIIGNYISLENIHEELLEDNDKNDDNKSNDEDEDNENKDNDCEFKYNIIYNSLGLLNKRETWEAKLNYVKKYIDENNKKPSYKDENPKIKLLCLWIYSQHSNYKLKEGMMKIKENYDKWSEFINDKKYNKYFLNQEEEWNRHLIQVKEYIDKNNKRPSKCIEYSTENNYKKLGAWITTQMYSYELKKDIMKNKKIYNKWSEFINSDKYKIYFRGSKELFQDYLELVKKYIDENDKRPSKINKETKKIGKWLSHQIENYKYKKKNMKIKEIYDE